MRNLIARRSDRFSGNPPEKYHDDADHLFLVSYRDVRTIQRKQEWYSSRSRRAIRRTLFADACRLAREISAGAGLGKRRKK